MKKTKKILLGCSLALLGSFAQAQNGLENITVEKFYVSNAADAAGSVGTLPSGSITYRVYADMLPGYKFQALFGITGHSLTVSSSTSFFNNEDFGATTPAISATNVRKNSVLLDSYFSVGGAANGKVGVLKSEDSDGSTGNAQGILQNNDGTIGGPINIGTTTSLSAFDGMIAGTPASVTFVGIANTGNGDLGVFDGTSQVGGSFSTSNGSIAALGGATGPTAANRVLVGQFTTTGIFQFNLNVQIGTPTGGSQQYVAQNPTGNQISIPSLIFSSVPSAPTATSPVNYCVGSSSSQLTATASSGCTLNWYTVATGGIGTATAPTPSTGIAGTTTYYVSQINSIGNESSRTPIVVIVTPIPATPGVITTSAANVCANIGSATNVNYHIASVTNATSYNWTVPTGASIVLGQGSTSINVLYSTAFTTGNVAVQAVSCASSAFKTLAVTKTAVAIPGVISGPIVGVCTSASYSIAAITGASSYTWVAPIGASVIGGQGTTVATFSFDPSFVTGNISVKSNNACGSSALKVLAVKSALATPGVIGGLLSGLCPSGISSTTYTIAPVAGATSYTWVAPLGASITGGQGTTSANVTFSGSFVSGNLSVTASTACVSSIAKVLALKSKVATPGVIGGAISGLCPSGVSSSTYTIAPVVGATGYTWVAPVGASIVSGQNSTSVTVSFSGTFTSGNLSVTADNGCGSSVAKLLALKSILAAPGTIGGIVSGLCPSGVSSTTYTIVPVVGATGYNWVAPIGASVSSGQGTTSATISFGSLFTAGSLSVTATNACGNSPVKVLALKSLLAAPVTVSGIVSGLCPSGISSTTYTITPVVGATGYNWVTPIGASVSSGQGTANATIDFGALFTAGSLSVTATNACGNSPVKVLALKSILAAPGVITRTPSVICANSTGVVYSIAAVAGATDYTWTVPAGASIIGGQGTINLIVDFGSTAGAVTVKANNACGSSLVKSIANTFACMITQSNNNNLRSMSTNEEDYVNTNIYPNPTLDILNFEILSDNDKEVTIELFDVLGNKVNTELYTISNGINTLTTNVEHLIKGMYFIRITDLLTNSIENRTFVKQ